MDQASNDAGADLQSLAAWGRRPPAGSPPGTFVPPADASESRFRLFTYDTSHFEELTDTDIERLPRDRAGTAASWLEVQGLGDLSALQAVGGLFALHDLVLEDIVHLHQRPKVEPFDDHIYLVLRVPRAVEHFETEQISLLLGDSWLLTFEEDDCPALEPVRQRLRHGKGRIRSAGADYLAYAVIDAAVDAYFPRLESYGERIESLEAELTRGSDARTVKQIHTLKRELLLVRRAVWPLREMLAQLLHGDTPFISDTTRIYLRDCYDHAVQLMDMVEIYREVASGLIDIHLSSQSIRTNEIMKVLTVIATIFIPLSWVSGVYGMNFDGAVSPWNMPELQWTYGYPFALSLMLVIGLGLLGYFRWRGWLGGRRDES